MDLNTTYEAIISSGNSFVHETESGDPQRQPRHQLHHGPRREGHLAVSGDRRPSRCAARDEPPDDSDLPRRHGAFRPPRVVAQHHQAAPRRPPDSTSCPRLPGGDGHLNPRSRATRSFPPAPAERSGGSAQFNRERIHSQTSTTTRASGTRDRTRNVPHALPDPEVTSTPSLRSRPRSERRPRADPEFPL